MENLNKKSMVNRSGKVWAGLFIILVGSVMLLDNLGLYFPHWLITWSTILMAIGFFVGARQNFTGSKWLILVLIGLYFTLDDIFGSYDMSNVVFPIMLVGLGLYLITKPKGPVGGGKRKWTKQPEFFNATPGSENIAQEEFASTTPGFDTTASFDANDYISSINVFGGSNQVIYSKNLQGGEITAVFGGGDVNLTQSDFENEVILEVTAIFGGVKIILPANWQTKSEVTAIFGGVDDKRPILPLAENQPKKLLIIRGVVLFGGVEFKSY